MAGKCSSNFRAGSSALDDRVDELSEIHLREMHKTTIFSFDKSDLRGQLTYKIVLFALKTEMLQWKCCYNCTKS